MKNFVTLLISLWGLNAWAGVILEGYDPVSYFKSDQPQKGDPKFKTKQGEATYWFASEENKQAFLKDPKKYEPQYGGWCAYAVAHSKSKGYRDQVFPV